MAERGRSALSRENRAKLLREAGKQSWQEDGLSRVERVIRFIESCPVTKGHLAAKPGEPLVYMKLNEAQLEFVRNIYGRDVPVRQAIQSVPRGNGKTGLLAALALCHLAGPEAVPRGEVYSAAIDKDQAAILFDEMRAIVGEVPYLRARINIIKHFKEMEVIWPGPGEGSKYEALSKDHGPAHGLAPSFWCYDELGQAKGSDLYTALDTAMGKQPGSLGIIISVQAADDDHILSELIDDGLDGLDPAVYVQLLSAPEEADPFSPETWRACNPALGTFLSFEDMERQAAKAKRVPSLLSAFRNLRLNQRVAADERLIPRDAWLACAGQIDIAGLARRRAWGGLDLSSTTDLTSLVLEFEGVPRPVVAWFWMPAAKLDEMSHNDHKNYRVWMDQGWITATPGRAIDKRSVAFKLAEINALYDIQSIGYDEWRFADLEKILFDEGIDLPLMPVRQGFKTMSPCVDAMESDILDCHIVHNSNPVLTMCISNAVAVSDPAGNRKLDKKRSRSRIDGAVSLAMASGLYATAVLPDDHRAFRGDDVEAIFAAA